MSYHLSKKTRCGLIRNWQESGTTGRFLLFLEGLVSLFIGLIVPAALFIAFVRA